MIIMTLRLSKELRKKVRMEAAREDTSMNGFIVDVLESYFDWLEEKRSNKDVNELQNETKKRSNKKKPSKPKVQEETPVEEPEEEDRGSYGSGRVKVDDEWFKKGTDDKWVGEEKGEVYTGEDMKSMLGMEE